MDHSAHPPFTPPTDAAAAALPIDGELFASQLAEAAAFGPSKADLLARLAVLEGRLVSMPAIEQAKGALMLAYGLSGDAAYALLRFHSQRRNVKIRAIATQVTDLMSTSPSSGEAISRFNRLLDDVARNLHAAASRTEQARHAPSQGPGGPLTEIAPAELPEVMLKAVATAPPGITIAGNAPDLPLVYANDAFSEMTGYGMREVLGRNCRFLQGPDTDPRDVSTLSMALHHGRDVSLVMRNYRSDGSPFWNEVSISPIRNRTEQITHYIGTQIDITDRADHWSGVPG